jgi:hypothetical protein
MLRKMLDNQAQTAQNIGGGAKEQACPPNPIIGGATAHPAPPKFTPMYGDGSRSRRIVELPLLTLACISRSITGHESIPIFFLSHSICLTAKRLDKTDENVINVNDKKVTIIANDCIWHMVKKHI